MEMRATEDAAVGGGDLTPPLSPRACVLHDSALASHCSACFNPLPPRLIPPVTASSQNPATPIPLYCSTHCFSLDSSLHFTSGEPHLLRLFLESSPSAWESSSDLRLSLRLLQNFQNLPQHGISENLQTYVTNNGGFFSQGFDCRGNDEAKGTGNCGEGFSKKDVVLERIAGLMTNRERLVLGENQNDESSESLMEVIKEGAKLIAKARRMCRADCAADAEKPEFLLEEMVLCLVLSNAVEVQDSNGCSIGVAVYGTSFSWINHSCSPNACYRFLFGQEHNLLQLPLRIAPAAIGKRNVECELPFAVPESGYGPRVIIRNIKDLRKGEEVTIAYTDLLQPKEMRQAELWSKYRFSCSCRRCNAVPATYVDYALQAPCTADLHYRELPDNKLEQALECIDEIITSYLSFGDPRSCCESLENLLSHGNLNANPVERKRSNSLQKLKLNPFHYLSQNAYTTLASAYKVQAMYMSETPKKEEAFNMYKISAAYSLLLAGVVHHLFMFESSFIAPVANFFTNAGESLRDLARRFATRELLPCSKCHRCSLSLEPCSAISNRNRDDIFNCIGGLTRGVWNTLASESSFLNLIRNPVDFGWCSSLHFECCSMECNDEFMINIVQLGFHCLRYGEVLSSVCYGTSAQ